MGTRPITRSLSWSQWADHKDAAESLQDLPLGVMAIHTAKDACTAHRKSTLIGAIPLEATYEVQLLWVTLGLACRASALLAA